MPLAHVNKPSNAARVGLRVALLALTLCLWLQVAQGQGQLPGPAQASATPMTSAAREEERALDVSFGGDGRVSIATDGSSVTLQLERVGRGAQPGAAPVPQFIQEGHRVEYRRGALVESYTNTQGGLEQRFILRRPPEGRGELRLVMAVEGAVPSLLEDGATIALRAYRQQALAYGSLFVRDAQGRSLPAELEVSGQQIALRVDDAGAAYPIDIDPILSLSYWVHEKTLTVGPWDDQSSFFGYAVGMQDSRAAVGSGFIYPGAAEVFRNLEGTPLPPWFSAVHMEPAPGATGKFAAALAYDANTLAVGAPWFAAAQAQVGYVSIFVRSGSGDSWALQQTLVPSYAPPGNTIQQFGFGQTLALSGDTLVVGACGYADYTGRAFVFERSGGIWTQTAELQGLPEAWGNRFGCSVGIGNGVIAVSRPAAQAPYFPALPGQVHLFAKSNGAWTQQQVIVSNSSAVNDGFGYVIAMNGDRLAVRDSDSVQLFTRVGGTWTYQWNYPVGPFGGVGERPMALGPTRLLVGEPAATVSGKAAAGRVLVFNGSGASLSYAGFIREPTPLAGAGFGASIATSGNRVIAGAPNANMTAGRAQIFRRQLLGWSLVQQP